MLSVKGTEPFRQTHCRMRRRSTVLQGELPRGTLHERSYVLHSVRKPLAELGLEKRAGESQPGRGVRKAPVGEHHHVHRGCLTQGSDKGDGVQHLARLDKGAVAIEPDPHSAPSQTGTEPCLHVVDHTLPWLLLAHKAYGD